MRIAPALSPLAAALGLAIGISAAHADEAADAGATDLAKVEVTAAAPVKFDTPGTITTIDREQIDAYLVKDVRDLFRYEPGVSVISSPGRFGIDSINIRGLAGNRTRIEVDGVALPSTFSAAVASSSAQSGRNQIDLDNIKDVDVVRGPASALYPSDSLGGVVQLRTKDPLDYLQGGKSFGGQIKQSYDSADRSNGTTATFAFGNERNSLLLQAHYRRGHEADNKGESGGTGSSRTRPDPLTYKQSGALAKYVHNADSGRRDYVSVESSRTDTRANDLSSITSSSVDYYRSQDSNQRFQLGFGQSWGQLDSAIADTLEWNGYWQRTATHNNTQTDNASYYRYLQVMPVQEKVIGGKLLASKHLGQGSAVEQTISYGLDLSRTMANGNIYGYGVNKSTGATGTASPYTAGSYPMHLMPDSKTNRYSLFGQDKIEFLDGRLALTPGVRIDRYEYKPENDSLYYTMTGSTRHDYSASRASFKFGALWQFNDNLSAYFNYAEGFRPPTYSELDGAWSERSAYYNISFIPNPDLKKETSRGGEIGLRGTGQAGWFNLSGYYTYYDNFIWNGYQLASSDIPAWVYALAPNAYITYAYQAVNAKHAYIKGIEASGLLRLGYFDDALDGWSINGSVAISQGRLIEPGDTGYSPLNTVDPAKAVLGVAYDADNWGAQLVATAVRRHSQLDDSSDFRPPGYAKLDLFGHYDFGSQWQLNIGLNNLTDRKYWDWGSLQSSMLGNAIGSTTSAGVTSADAVDLYTMPGRSVSASLRYSF